MRIDPVIEAMRRDRSVLQQAQGVVFDAARRWSQDPRIAPVVEELDAFGAGASLFDCPLVSDLFGPGRAAQEFVASFARGQCAALTEARFAQVPFRHAYDGRMATLLLAQRGPARLTLVSFEPGSHAGGPLVFSDSVRHEAVLAGRAQATRTVHCRDGAFERSELALEAGSRLTLDLSSQALFVHRVAQRLVCLRLARDSAEPGPMREYDPATGALRRQASGSSRDSRHETMLALLGRMKRTEAAPTMADLALSPGPDTLRWEALRECLALDTATGFAALCAVACRPGDPLAMAAGALRAQLVEAHPQRLQLEATACRA
ncbi:hypothetical protein [Tsuneonella sp. HG222]